MKRPSVSVAGAEDVDGRPFIDTSEVFLGTTGGGGPLDGGAGGGGRELSGLEGFGPGGPNGDRIAGGLGALLSLAAGIGGGAIGLAAVTGGGGGGGAGVFLDGNPPGMTFGGGIGGPVTSLRGTGGEFLFGGIGGIGGPGGAGGAGGGGIPPELCLPGTTGGLGAAAGSSSAASVQSQ